MQQPFRRMHLFVFLKCTRNHWFYAQVIKEATTSLPQAPFFFQTLFSWILMKLIKLVTTYPPQTCFFVCQMCKHRMFFDYETHLLYKNHKRGNNISATGTFCFPIVQENQVCFQSSQMEFDPPSGIFVPMAR